jgi:tetratricopeptide (TPR) repeat protein
MVNLCMKAAILPHAVSLSLFLSLSVVTWAEDTVICATGKDGRGRRTATGTIVDFTGEHLVLRTASGRDQTIPAKSVVDIRTTRTPDQVAGDGFARAGQHEEAVNSYLTALRDERRVWVRRQIMAQCVRCFGELEQFDRAAEGFLTLVRSDPQTQYFDVIPLSWSPYQPPLTFMQKAKAWLEDERNSVAQLLGASWLLSTDAREAAIAALRGLNSDADARVAMLAETQLWRTRVVIAKPQDIDRWRSLIARVPKELRAGPYFTLGRALAAQGQSEQAALAFLRVPILHPANARLAAAALLSAGRELERIGQTGQAVTLYQEVVRDHGDAPAAGEAAGRLEKLASQGSS